MARPYVGRAGFVPITGAAQASPATRWARTLHRVRDIALDESTGDLGWSRSSSGLRQLSLTAPGAAAVRQKLVLRLGLGQGEYALDQRKGMPYFQQLFVKATGRRLAESVFRRAITTCPGVATLESFRLTVGTDRTARLSFVARALGDSVPVVVSDFIPAGV